MSTKDEIVATSAPAGVHGNNREEVAQAIVGFEDDVHRAALEDNPDHVSVGWKTWAAIFFMAISFGPPVGIAFGSVAAVIVPVSMELNGFNQMAWAVGAWSVGTAASFSVGGALSDTFGRKWPIIAGQFLTIIGYILGGTAKEISSLIAAETLIGLGCGLIFVSYAGVPEMLPNKWRSLGLGILDAGVAFPWGIIAVILGQALNQYASWRWIFWISIIVEFIGMVGTFVFYTPTSRPRGDFTKSRLQQIMEIDWVGLFLFIGGMVIFLVGVTSGGTEGKEWENAPAAVIAPIVVGLVTVVAAFVYDFTVAKNPLFPLSLFKMVREYTLLLVVIFVSGMLYSGLLPILTQGSSYMFTTDGIEIGLMSLPYTIMTFIVGCVVPMVAHKIGHMKIQVIVAAALQAAFIGATASAAAPNSYWAWVFLPAFGIPMFTWLTILTYSVASLHVPYTRLGLAMGLLGTFRSSGGAVGNAIFSSVLNTRFNEYLGEELVPLIFMNGYGPENITEIIVGSIQLNNGVPFQLMAYPEPVKAVFREAVRVAWGRAFRFVFYITIPFSVVAFLCTLFIEDSTKYMTNHVQMSMGRKEFRDDGSAVVEDSEANGGAVTTKVPTTPSTVKDDKSAPLETASSHEKTIDESK